MSTGGGSGGLRLHFIYNLPGCCQLLVIKKIIFSCAVGVIMMSSP